METVIHRRSNQTQQACPNASARSERKWWERQARKKKRRWETKLDLLWRAARMRGLKRDARKFSNTYKKSTADGKRVSNPRLIDSMRFAKELRTNDSAWKVDSSLTHRQWRCSAWPTKTWRIVLSCSVSAATRQACKHGLTPFSRQRMDRERISRTCKFFSMT